LYLYLYLDRRSSAVWLVAAFYAPFGMFIVNLLDSILSLKQMLHFTSGSSACQR